MKTIYIYFLLFCISSTISLNGQCIDEAHSPFKNQGWLSCNTTASPNSLRGDSHWLMYDLGHMYTIDSIQIWNHNVWGETGNGAKWIIIDYSNDQSNWQPAGTFKIEKAPGSWKYQSNEVLDLNHAQGQYFLITVLEAQDENASCVGIAEVKFAVGISSSTEEEINEDTWAVYPNPALDNITVDLKNVSQVNQVIISDGLGRVIKNVENANSDILNLDVSDFNEGMYYISIRNEDRIDVKSFVKVNLR